jgi:succinylglutamate desuccinylase
MRDGAVSGCGTAISCNVRGNETAPVELRDKPTMTSRAKSAKPESDTKKPGSSRAFDAHKF